MGGLFVAVPAGRAPADPGTGAGRVWTSVMRVLHTRVRVRELDPGRRRLGRRPDVWLIPGHEGPVERPEPVVAVVHGSAWTLEAAAVRELVPPTYAARMIALTEATLACAGWVIAPSQYTRRGLVEGYGLAPERVAAVPHGVDTGVFHPGARGGRERVARALGAERPYVLFASIPSIAQKNLPALKTAMGRLAEGGLPQALVIAGGTAGGESPELLAEIAADLPEAPGRVAWLGHAGDAELAALMAGADAFCLPSLIESFGLTALEAMACGAPVIVSDRGALPEVVADAGVISEPTPAALEDALRGVLCDPERARRLRAAARERALTMSWEATAGGWLEVLDAAAGYALSAHTEPTMRDA
jgi:glycosyltransferase involved in cell wall biosynthesis